MVNHRRFLSSLALASTPKLSVEASCSAADAMMTPLSDRPTQNPNPEALPHENLGCHSFPLPPAIARSLPATMRPAGRLGLGLRCRLAALLAGGPLRLSRLLGLLRLHRPLRLFWFLALVGLSAL